MVSGCDCKAASGRVSVANFLDAKIAQLAVRCLKPAQGAIAGFVGRETVAVAEGFHHMEHLGVVGVADRKAAPPNHTIPRIFCENSADEARA